MCCFTASPCRLLQWCAQCNPAPPLVLLVRQLLLQLGLCLHCCCHQLLQTFVQQTQQLLLLQCGELCDVTLWSEKKRNQGRGGE